MIFLVAFFIFCKNSLGVEVEGLSNWESIGKVWRERSWDVLSGSAIGRVFVVESARGEEFSCRSVDEVAKERRGCFGREDERRRGGCSVRCRKSNPRFHPALSNTRPKCIGIGLLVIFRATFCEPYSGFLHHLWWMLP